MKKRIRRWLLDRLNGIDMADHRELGEWTSIIEKRYLKELSRRIETETDRDKWKGVAGLVAEALRDESVNRRFLESFVALMLGGRSS
jgi:hypothetical protein